MLPELPEGDGRLRIFFLSKVVLSDIKKTPFHPVRWKKVRKISLKKMDGPFYLIGSQIGF